MLAASIALWPAIGLSQTPQSATPATGGLLDGATPPAAEAASQPHPAPPPSAPAAPAPPPASAPIVAAAPITPPADSSIAPPGVASPQVADAPTLLLQQATFWRAQNEPAKATASLRRLLDLQPNNVDALALLIATDALQGNGQEAQTYFDRLKTLAPQDKRIPYLQGALSAGAVDQAALLQARTLVQQAKTADAVKAYQAAFHGSVPPPELAIEYYSVYGNLNIVAFEQARHAMASIVANDPQDVANQLAYARLLVNRELTRTEGIDRLSKLADLPSIGAAARITWRQALLWQGPDPVANRQLLYYLSRNPSDPQLEAQRLLYKQSLPDESLQVLSAAFDDMNKKRMTEAEQEFEKTLDLDPKSVRAMTMLAVIRKQQNRPQDAHDLIEQALSLEPQNKDWILKTTGGDPTDRNAAGGYTAADARRDAMRAGHAVQAQYMQVARLSSAGRYGEAQTLLTRLLRGRTSGNVQLADLQLLNGQSQAAEANFRAALRINPNNADAVAGLARALDQQGRTVESAPLYDRARDLYEARGNRTGVETLAQLQAARLRDEAERSTEITEKLSLYRQAITAVPDDPWLRLAYARLLASQGETTSADSVMAPVQAMGTASALQASIYYAQSNNDYDRAGQLIAQLPPRARTAQMRQLQAQVTLRNRVRGILAGGSPEEQTDELLALSRAPDPDGSRGSTIGRALITIGAKSQVRTAIDNAIAATGGDSASQRLSYSGVLLAAGQTREAQSMVARVDAPTLNADQRQSLRGIRNGIAVVSSDRLNAAGRPDAAYDTLVPRLQDDPHNPSLRMALSRLYQSNGKPAEALAINRSVLKENAGDIDARMATIDTALASNNLGLAANLAREGIRQAPDDPRIYMKAAAVAQARGSNLEAINDLKQARLLRQRQLAGASD